MAPAAQAPAKPKARRAQPPKSVAATAEGREAPPIPQAEIEQLLESWLEAQNEREFEAYQALYAEKFFGLRRSGHRTYTYDRDGWLEDRRRIFKRRLKVELKDCARRRAQAQRPWCSSSAGLHAGAETAPIRGWSWCARDNSCESRVKSPSTHTSQEPQRRES